MFKHIKLKPTSKILVILYLALDLDLKNCLFSCRKQVNQSVIKYIFEFAFRVFSYYKFQRDSLPGGFF